MSRLFLAICALVALPGWACSQDAGEEELKRLIARAEKADKTETLRHDVIAFQRKHLDGAVAVKAAGLLRDLASPPRLRSASFELHRGEVLGIGGLVGSGRSELVRALFGLAPSTGDVEVRGKKIINVSAAEQISNHVGYLSEDRKHEGLFLQLSVADNLTFTAPERISRGGWIDLRKQQSASDQIIGRLSIRSAQPNATVARLSGGNQQKVAVGRLLHQDPDILLLDEPTRGIDIRSKADIYREIRALADRGKAILMVSSYLPELMGVCDRIAVMTRGVLSPVRDVAAWTPHSIMEVAISEVASPEAC